MKSSLSPCWLAAVLAGALVAPAVQAGGIPVTDPVNLQQNMVTALESVKQTLQQIEQYKTQLEQFENMEKNTTGLADHLWQQAQASMAQWRAAMEKLPQEQQPAGGLDAYLAQFKDLEGYRAAVCSGTGCDRAEEAQQGHEQARLGSQVQKQANDAVFKGLARQQQASAGDTQDLARLQGVARGAQGQMQALGAGNQLTVHAALQLQKIRALLAAHLKAAATRQQVVAAREAQAQAKLEKAVAARMVPTVRPMAWLKVKP